MIEALPELCALGVLGAPEILIIGVLLAVVIAVVLMVVNKNKSKDE